MEIVFGSASRQMLYSWASLHLHRQLFLMAPKSHRIRQRNSLNPNFSPAKNPNFCFGWSSPFIIRISKTILTLAYIYVNIFNAVADSTMQGAVKKPRSIATESAPTSSSMKDSFSRYAEYLNQFVSILDFFIPNTRTFLASYVYLYKLS